MTERLDTRLAAVERRLERASTAAAPPGLRRRVLSAIEGTAFDTESRWSVESSSLFPLAVVPNAIFVSAVAAVIVIVAFSASVISNSPVPLTLDERVRLTRVGDDLLATPTADARTTDLVLRPRQMDDIPVHRDTLRVLDAQRMLQEPL